MQLLYKIGILFFCELVCWSIGYAIKELYIYIQRPCDFHLFNKCLHLFFVWPLNISFSSCLFFLFLYFLLTSTMFDCIFCLKVFDALEHNHPCFLIKVWGGVESKNCISCHLIINELDQGKKAEFVEFVFYYFMLK